MEATFKTFLIKKIHSPAFLMGCFVKIILWFLIKPNISEHFYIPFMEMSISRWSFEPWQLWLSHQGDIQAFPYGYVMWLSLFPFHLLGHVLHLPSYVAYMVALLLADIGILYVLENLVQFKALKSQLVYWFSPIIILATYVLGYNDIIPVLFLFLAIDAIKRYQFSISGFLLFCAISAKLSMIIALPFFVIYLFNHRVLRNNLLPFSQGALFAFLIFILPFMFSASGRLMLFNNPEILKVYQYALSFDDIHKLYILPLCYLIMLYIAWRIQRMNFEMFLSILGLAFLLIVLLVPTSPGWFVWVAPFLVINQMTMERTGNILIICFLLMYSLDIFTLMSNFEMRFLNLNIHLFYIFKENAFISSILITITTSLGLILWASIWRSKINNNDFFRLSRKPFVIGIAGDSGAGKDTYANALTDIFGHQTVAYLSGDDYHHWDRHKPMWQVMTHLNPLANNLQAFTNDLLLLISGKGIYKRHYDHGSGIMSRTEYVKSNDIIIASGLHALYLPILRTSYHLSIFLDIDENLRKAFKIARDTTQRGHSIQQVLSTFERREPDSKKFIRPQKEFSDLVFTLLPIYNKNLYQDVVPEKFKLKVSFLNQFNEQEFIRVLVGILGLQVDVSVEDKTAKVTIMIDGDISAEDVAFAAKLLCPNILEFMDLKPKWKDGMLGIMQLITLTHIHQSLMKRSV